MATIDDALDTLFRSIGSGDIGIEVTIHRDRERLDIGEIETILKDLRQCRAWIHAVTAFARWLFEKREASPPSGQAMDRFLASLSDGSIGEAERALDNLAPELAKSHFYERSDGDVLLFGFGGGYHVNPIHLGFIATGAALPLTILAIVFGTVQVRKANTEADCLARADRMTEMQIAMLKDALVFEKRWTSELEQSLGTVNDAAGVAANRCGSTLGSITVEMTIPHLFSFKVGIGPQDEAHGM